MTNHVDKQYKGLIDRISADGVDKVDRTGVGSRSVFGAQMRFDISDGKLPLLTTKKVHTRMIIHELLWMLSGDTNVRYLKENNVNIWDSWSRKESESGKDFDNRDVVYVEPRVKEFNKYYNPTPGLTDDQKNDPVNEKLYPTWYGMLKRCYDSETHNYSTYGGRNVFVCERWHTFTNFVEDVKRLPNWKNKFNNWNEYNLDKDYYSSNCYSPDTCVWLSETENSMYSGKPAVIAVDPLFGVSIFPCGNEAARQLGLARNTLHRFLDRMPSPLKGKNAPFRSWLFLSVVAPFRYEIPEIGDLGPVYGSQWRNWGDGKPIRKSTIRGLVNLYKDDKTKLAEEITEVFKNRSKNGHDQIANIVHQLKTNPDSRRIILNAWNVGEINEMGLPPCHCLAQFWTRKLTFEERGEMAKRKGFLIAEDPQGGYDNAHLALDALEIPRRALSCQLYQRSADTSLGVPFNLVQYSLLTHMLAHVTGMVAEELIWVGGDCHVYQNQWEALEEQLSREPLEDNGAKLWLNPEVKDIDDFTFKDIGILNYKSHPPVKFPAAAV
tara:strand:+ start:2533 stop:4182 length:1650 start_codon:yes stop_codon:yes gene_type:complete